MTVAEPLALTDGWRRQRMRVVVCRAAACRPTRAALFAFEPRTVAESTMAAPWDDARPFRRTVVGSMQHDLVGAASRVMFWLGRSSSARRRAPPHAAIARRAEIVVERQGRMRRRRPRQFRHLARGRRHDALTIRRSCRRRSELDAAPGISLETHLDRWRAPMSMISTPPPASSADSRDVAHSTAARRAPRRRRAA